MKKLILSISRIKLIGIFVLASVFANADTPDVYKTACGATKFRVDVVNNGHRLDNTFTLSVVTSSGTKLLFKGDEGGWFDAACLQAKGGKSVLVFQSYCGGNGCLEGKYGAIEPSTLKFLLRPSSKNIENHKQLSELLGSPALHLGDYQGRFCCGEVSVLNNLR